jgi:hypothetical protein
VIRHSKNEFSHVSSFEEHNTYHKGPPKVGKFIEQGFKNLADLGELGMNTIGASNSIETREQQGEAREAMVAEGNARAQAFSDIASSDLDTMSRNELIRDFESGSSSGELAAKLTAAREGKGIYAVRRINEAQKAAMRLTPGRAQLRGGFGALF